LALALFDLDNTLLNGDSDHAWGLFLAKVGAVDADQQEQMQDYFYQQYLAGSLDIDEFLEFQLKPLTQHSVAQLHAWRIEFIDQIIQPMLDNGKTNLLAPHREAQDKIIIITATNDFITRPIADMLGVNTLLATTVEFIEGRYTGNYVGTPCFAEGKVGKLNGWMADHQHSLQESYFYSDSINDLPLLKQVKHPIAVTPDEQLRDHAEKAGWQIID